MSLINQMLQDLDARRATHGPGARLPSDVRSLPMTEHSHLPIILGFTLLLALVAGFSFYWWEMRPLASVPPATSFAVPPAYPATTIPEVGIVVSPEAVREDPAPTEQLVLPALEGSLRMTDFLKPPTDDRAAPRPAVAAGVAEKPLPNRNKVKAERNATEAKELPAPLNLSERPVKAPRIERSDPVGTAQDRAESAYRKALTAVNQGRVAEAIDSLHAVLQQDGLHSASRQLLVKLLLEASRSDEAIKVLQEGLLAQSAQINWAMSLARMQVERGDLTGALKTLEHSMPPQAVAQIIKALWRIFCSVSDDSRRLVRTIRWQQDCPPRMAVGGLVSVWHLRLKGIPERRDKLFCAPSKVEACATSWQH